MPEPEQNPYTVLGLEPGSGTDAIKQAYFALVRAHPPEREPETFKQIRAAYEQLRDPTQRLDVDMLHPIPWSSPTTRQRRAPALDLTLHHEDVIAAAASLTDLERTDWRALWREVRL